MKRTWTISFQVRICVECLRALWNLVDERGFAPRPPRCAPLTFFEYPLKWAS
jgi:hypothetical protein